MSNGDFKDIATSFIVEIFLIDVKSGLEKGAYYLDDRLRKEIELWKSDQKAFVAELKSETELSGSGRPKDVMLCSKN